ncbi:hypothetical protein [Pyrobaculum ferrireducens]|uniref:Uncharacterized protein n=1 Tax=Pyrobaculum ferrireducens TaxID=1104324 RepID=G7VAP7_9CREN|nr:hypothetical protein [Pyrobaculum ferrireducens]AET32286.1 hypothetical protein P186_0844 [Pyrobaculum ferrireducens]
MDLLRIGVFLLGVAALIVAVIGLMIYLERPRPAPTPPFYAYCVDKYVVVSANAELRGVKVYEPGGAVYCVFDQVKAGSDAACRVGNGTLYVVEWEGYTKAVQCAPPPPPRPATD